MEFRVEFQEVTGAISTVMELRVFGCAEGKMTIFTFSSNMPKDENVHMNKIHH